MNVCELDNMHTVYDWQRERLAPTSRERDIITEKLVIASLRPRHEEREELPEAPSRIRCQPPGTLGASIQTSTLIHGPQVLLPSSPEVSVQMDVGSLVFKSPL